ncbi:MAG: hypothetical protein U9N77_16710, partial [Thermodesulfobacteriota bacterium]|nr:hypothetical protein [Thermodesulfobacteriota bacterium]
MKYFPVKTVLLCLLLPSILYTCTLTLLEKNLCPVYQQKIENRITGGSESLLDGSVRVQDAVGNNIHIFLKKDFLVNTFNLELDILVTDSSGKIMYPFFEKINSSLPGIAETWDSVEIARHNYEILNQGLIVKVVVPLRHGTFAANSILILYMGLGLLIFFIYYRRWSVSAAEDDNNQDKIIAGLVKDKRNFSIILDALKKERSHLFEQVTDLQKKHQEDKESKKKAFITEDEMFEEIVSLEKKLNANIESQQDKEEEIHFLKEELKKHERRKGCGSKRRAFDLAVKRFATLYKNIDMNRKALSSFFDLKDAQQIKAEELIHQLNENSDSVKVKRKVFIGKKNKSASFEILFAYNGRLYFRKIDG